MLGVTRFCRFQLRTTNVAAAHAFYATVLGDENTDIMLLPAEAVLVRSTLDRFRIW